jgi:molybdopterin molybdotransferase/putative molybdopterin biosynthesis protein
MKRKQQIYRHLKTPAEAGAILREHFGASRTEGETVSVRKALDRVLVGPVKAARSVPAYHAAAMDGVAVSAAATFGAVPERPVTLPKGARASYVDTGDPLPEGIDAVVMIEKVEEAAAGWEVREAVYPWQNVRKVGEDIVKGDIVLPARHRLRPYDQGALLAAGVLSVEVFRRPRVLIIPTGDEIVLPEDAADALPKGALVEFNGQMLASMVAECGGEALLRAPVPDDPEALRKAIEEGLSQGYDLILVIAGSSTGSADFTPTLLGELGQLLVHGVTVMPGKPTVLAAVNGRPVVGIPGYPVSAVVAFREFVRPLLFGLQGLLPPEPQKLTVTVGRKLPSKLGLEEQVRVILGRVGKHVVAIPLAGGAGVISSLVRADGIIRIPQELSGVSEAETVEAELLKPIEVIDNNILAIGSHDLTLDLLASLIKEKTNGRYQLASSNVGSLGGLLAVRKHTAHFAGSHLLDTRTGEYNLSYVRQHLRGMAVTLVTLVYRWQGFMVAPGNPKGIQGVRDLARSDVTYVNRQAGSGTRILIDFELAKAGIGPDSVAGYRNEEYTHMNVAVAVLSGAADTGLGIYAAAQALGLDFIPVTRERYDLVIPTAFLEDPRIRLLLEIIRSDDFKKKVLDMGGYEIEETGNIAAQTAG